VHRLQIRPIVHN